MCCAVSEQAPGSSLTCLSGKTPKISPQIPYSGQGCHTRDVSLSHLSPRPKDKKQPGDMQNVCLSYEVPCYQKLSPLCFRCVVWTLVISWKSLIKYYEYSFDYLTIIMNQLRLMLLLSIQYGLFLTGHRLTGTC